MIRAASHFDITIIIEMLKHFRDNALIPELRVSGDEEHGRRVLTQLIAGAGIVLVAEQDNKTVGMLIAGKTPNIWDPKYITMNEVVYWVEPEYRGATHGYRLLKKYIEMCDKMITNGTIAAFTVGRMSDNKAINYGRFGFRQVEETWARSPGLTSQGA